MIFDYRKHRASHRLGSILRAFNEMTRGIEVLARVPDYPSASPWAEQAPPENCLSPQECLLAWARAIA